MLESDNTTPQEKVRTTVDLPSTVKERIEQALERGAAKSQSALIVRAVECFLEDLERAWVDAQFSEMADDEDNKALQLRIAQEFAPAESTLPLFSRSTKS